MQLPASVFDHSYPSTQPCCTLISGICGRPSHIQTLRVWPACACLCFQSLLQAEVSKVHEAARHAEEEAAKAGSPKRTHVVKKAAIGKKDGSGSSNGKKKTAAATAVTARPKRTLPTPVPQQKLLATQRRIPGTDAPANRSSHGRGRSTVLAPGVGKPPPRYTQNNYLKLHKRHRVMPSCPRATAPRTRALRAVETTRGANPRSRMA